MVWLRTKVLKISEISCGFWEK